MHYILKLPFPPSNNNLHRTGHKSSIRYKSKAYVKWLKAADDMAIQQKPFKVFTKRVQVECYLNGGADNYDSDNFLKAPMDYIVRLGIVEDDCKKYVKGTSAEWEEDASKKIITMVIKEI